MRRSDEWYSGLEAVVQDLTDEPLFHFSLGSKELFHSDFLAWFVSAAPEAATAVFQPWTSSGETGDSSGAISVRREKGHLDLLIDVPGMLPLVIENKVFSLPDETQLADYGTKLPLETSCVLLSLVDPGWVDGATTIGSHRWRYLSYGALAVAIGDALSIHPPRDPFTADLLCHYRRFCAVLVRLRDLCGIDAQDPQDLVHLDERALEILRRGRVHDAAQKLRARQIAQLLQQELGRDLHRHVVIGSGYAARGNKALLEAFIPVGEPGEPGDKDDLRDWIGWQLEGNQFRLAVQVGDRRLHSRKDPARRQAREEYVAARYERYFDFGDLGAVPKSTKGWNGYDPNFVYRYRLIDGITVGELADIVRHFTRRALHEAEG
jgi:hypothetical protein